ncbi:uncharacterized protein LOC125177636 isoform X2 [Hyalella azteca]|uniref:Uncharacterized protein LOC125177636 isoform X1 n=1 Tax=Hyalella azteca TaxID=294128 RepID=A0A979FFP6_HYAAZ|nr:uncharacterized protein LOC125177636 isoform X1 [Hyalella azteca]XP_047735733.1 uncharacterized protein LOC125177636 isoform X2 [Hyalella azteca]
MLWDQQENLSLVLRLVQCLGCVESFTSVVLSRLLPLMATAPLPTACAVITCFTNTALNWCLTFKNNSEIMEDEGFAMVEGVLDLARQLDSCFLGSCLVHSLHPMLLHCILSFYHTINDCCEELSLPLVLCPSPPLTALMLSTTDVGIVHSLGILLSRLPAAYERIKTSTRENSRHAAFCAEVFKHTSQNNKCLQLYINCAHDSLVFVNSTEAWREMCTIFLGNKLVLAMLGARGLRYSGAMASQLQCAVLRSQAPPPVAGQAFAAESVEVRDYVLKALADMGLSGIQDFINSLKDPDSPTVELES